MRSIGLIILITVAFTWAAQTRVMQIYMHDGTIESIPCNRLDPDAGITFFDNNLWIKIGVGDRTDPYDPASPTYTNKSILTYCTCRIDSITFVLIGEPDPTPAPQPAPELAKRLSKHQQREVEGVAFKKSGLASVFKATR
jgi:hypothetical protein